LGGKVEEPVFVGGEQGKAVKLGGGGAEFCIQLGIDGRVDGCDCRDEKGGHYPYRLRTHVEYL
jgi:hypothetical protein